MAASSSGHKGFSLIEILLVLFLFVSLAMAALPMLASLSSRLRTEMAVHSLLGAIHLARSEAVRRGVPTTLCRAAWNDTGDRCSTDALSCNGRPSGSRDWRCGWLVIVGKGMGGFTSTPVPHVIRRFTGVGALSIRRNGATQRVTFRPPAGQATGQAGSFEIGALASAGQYVRCLKVAINGRARVVDGACAS